MKGFRIHQLVANTWSCKPNGNYILNHKDGDKLNNHIDNLEWITQADNIKHCKEVLQKNLNISFSKIEQLYNDNKNIDIKNFMNLIKNNCK